MTTYFNTDQKTQMERVRFLQKEVAACSFYVEPCKLLKAQVNEARVLVDRLSEALRKLDEELGATP